MPRPPPGAKQIPDASGVTWLDAEMDLLRYWIEARESVRSAKESGRPGPWTADPFLRDYRWCNVRRMDDRVSRELFERWYVPSDPPDPSRDVTLAVLARLINWPAALDEIGGDLGAARRVLMARFERGGKCFTGAYLVPGVPGQRKIDSVCNLVEEVGADAQAVLQPTMRESWQRLMGHDRLGSFLAGQIVADLAHLPPGREWPDRETWAPLGPGSARGINRLRGIPKDRAVSQADFERLLPQLIVVLRPRIAEIWTDRGLHAMDIQNCLCEFDKYRRLQLGEGKVRAKFDSSAGDAALAAQRALFD